MTKTDLPKDFPKLPPGAVQLFTEHEMFKRRTGYANFCLLHTDHTTDTFWCVPCASSVFVRGSQSLDVRQPTIRCEKCKRRWRIRGGVVDRKALEKLPFRELRGES